MVCFQCMLIHVCVCVLSFSFGSGSSSTLTSDCATINGIEQQNSCTIAPSNKKSELQKAMTTTTADASNLFAHLETFQSIKNGDRSQIAAANVQNCAKPFANIVVPNVSVALRAIASPTKPMFVSSNMMTAPVVVTASPSFYQIAKDFCGNVKQKAKNNIDSSMDELTKRMATMQLGIPKCFASHNIKSNLSKFGSLMDICSGF